MDQDIKKELEQTNKLLERHVKISSRIFRTFYLRSFLSGVLSALGALFATTVLTGLIIYYISRLPFIKEIKPFLEKYYPSNQETQIIKPSNGNTNENIIIEKNAQSEPDQP
jgi:hypothetical protein